MKKSDIIKKYSFVKEIRPPKIKKGDCFAGSYVPSIRKQVDRLQEGKGKIFYLRAEEDSIDNDESPIDITFSVIASDVFVSPIEY